LYVYSLATARAGTWNTKTAKGIPSPIRLIGDNGPTRRLWRPLLIFFKNVLVSYEKTTCNYVSLALARTSSSVYSLTTLPLRNTVLSTLFGCACMPASSTTVSYWP